MLLLVRFVKVVLGSTLVSVTRLVKKKKEIKIVRESEMNYTFLDTGLVDNKQDSENRINKNIPDLEKDILKTRTIDSKKSKIRHKNRIAGGQIQQSHSSVYE